MRRLCSYERLPRCAACAERCPNATSPLGSLRERQESRKSCTCSSTRSVWHSTIMGGAPPRSEKFELRPVDAQVSLGAAELDPLALQSGLRRVEVCTDPLAGIFEMQIDRVLHRASIFGEKCPAGVVRRNGSILSHEHVDDIYPMHELVGENAAAKIAIVPEVEVLRRIPCAPGNGT